MKIGHNSLKEIASANEGLKKAQELEKLKDLAAAAAAYENVIKKDPVNELAYQRLMIIYRKLKQIKKELSVIKKGIKSFQDYYMAAAKRTHAKNVVRISNILMKSIGLTDKKGKPVYQPEPLAKWNRRKALVEKKIKTQQ